MMQTDDKEIPEYMLQSYIDEQRQIARNAGCEAMTKISTVIPIMLTLSMFPDGSLA